MKSLFRQYDHQFPARRLLLAGLLALGALLSFHATAAMPLEAWRNGIADLRAKAENDAPQAYLEAQLLQKESPAAATPADRARMLNLLARAELYLGLIDRSSQHSAEARSIAKQGDDRVGQIEANLVVAASAINQGRLEDMVDATRANMDLLVGLDREDLRAEVMFHVAMMYLRFGQLDEAATVAMQSLDIARRSKNPQALAYAEQGMASVYAQSGRYAEAREHYLRMREAALRARSVLLEAGAVLGLSGAEYVLGNAMAGERQNLGAIALFRRAGGPLYVGHAMFQLADHYLANKQPAKALPLLDGNVGIYEEHANPIGLWWTLNKRSAVLQELGRLAAARDDAERAHGLARQLGFTVYLAGSARRLSEVAAAQGDYKRAYRLSAEAAELAGKLEREKSGQRILELAKRFQEESRQRKIDELNRQSEGQHTRQRQLLIVLAATAVLLGITVFFLLRLRRSREEIRALNAGLERRVLERTAELLESQQSLAEAQRIAHVGSWEMNLVDNVLTWSDEIYRIFEIDPGEFGASYEAFMEMVHPDDRESLDRTYKTSLERREHFEIEHRLLLPGGRVKFVHERCETIYAADGKPLRSIGTVQDITERKLAEQRNREQGEFQEILLNAMNDVGMQLMMIESGRILHVSNRKLAHEFGYSDADIAAGPALMDIVHPDDRERVMDYHRRRLAGEDVPSSYELGLVTRNGERREYETSVAVVPGTNPVRIISVGKDVTERKQLEEALAKRESELRALAESSPGMMGSYYLRPDGSVCMPYASPNLYELFGVRPEEVAEDAEPLMRLSHPDDAQRVRDTIAESARTLTPWHCEYRIRHPLKGERWMEGHTNPQPHPDGGTIWYGYVHDITGRKRMEAALQESKARYRDNYNLLQAIIESPSSSVAIYAIDREYRLLAFNSRFKNAAKRLWNAEIEPGMSVLDAIDTEAHREFFKQGAAPVLAGNHGHLESTEDRIEDGRLVREYHDNFGSPIYNDNGDVIGMAIFVLNTTERKETELKLKEALEFTEGIINAIPDLLFEVDREGRYLNVWTQNPDLLAAQKEQLLGKTVAEVLAPENAAAAMRAIREADKQGASRIEDICIELPQGRRWFSHSLSKKPGGAAGKATFLVLSRDITERKRLEAELRDSRNFLDSVLDAVPDPLFVKDRQHRWVLLNDANCRFTGLPREALIGKSDYDIFPREEADVFWEKDELVFESGDVNLNEESFTSANGEAHFIQTKKTPFVSADGSQMLVGVIRDITERKRYEAAREAALAEARRLADLRSEFIAHMSHELRTPLNGILGYAQMLERDGRLDGRQQASMEVIRQSGEHLLALIEDILDLARIESGRLELDIGDIPLARFLDVVAGMVGIRARQKHLEFVCEFAPDLPQGIRGDEKRLRQVLLNLLSNAVKFTDQGKVVWRVERLASSRLAFTVADTGIGIASADREKIFQSFEQVSDARRRIGGTGLGLAISRQLVRLMGSDIEVESRMGEGSTFRFELELPEASIEPAAPYAASAGTLQIEPSGEDETAEPLVAPPREEMLELHRLALLGNMRDIVQFAERIKGEDSRYRPFAERLCQLAEGYQSKAILAFVEGFSK